MGEKTKTLARAFINNQEIEIELNNPLSKGKDEQIHIQTKKGRIEFNKRDFVQYAFGLLSAGKKLKAMKEINE